MESIIVQGVEHNIVLKSGLPIPEPGAGQVRIKIMAASINPADLKMLGNLNDHPMGLDGAGIIDKIGSAASAAEQKDKGPSKPTTGEIEWKVGDHCLFHAGFRKPGAFAQYIVQDAHTVAKCPASVSFEDAAALPCAAMTAYQALHHKLCVKEGGVVLITGGGGGVGGFAIQLAKLCSLTVITTASASSAAVTADLKSLGADHVFDYSVGGEALCAAILKLTSSRGVDYLLDCVSSESLQALLPAVAWGGSVCYVAGGPTTLPDMSRCLSFHAVFLGMVYYSGSRAQQNQLQTMGTQLAALVGEGKLKSRVTSKLSASDAVSWLQQRRLEMINRGGFGVAHNKTGGKLVITISHHKEPNNAATNIVPQ